MASRTSDPRRTSTPTNHRLADSHLPSYTLNCEEPPKTRRGHRVLSLDDGTVSMLRRHRDLQAEQRTAGGLRGRPMYVFTKPDGDPYSPDFVTKHFGVLVRRTSLPVIRVHDLRHTHATLGLAAGIPAKVMADRLGHSSVLMTLDIYSHVSPALDANAAALIARLIIGDGPPTAGGC